SPNPIRLCFLRSRHRKAVGLLLSCGFRTPLIEHALVIAWSYFLESMTLVVAPTIISNRILCIIFLTVIIVIAAEMALH
ncbi:MAG TPA: hypothetical protein VNG51_10610, partial [Ktedonobacteraceae bacterium]|nr:hypothetical protein [Ktedonobacteraceae bacterium]